MTTNTPEDDIRLIAIRRAIKLLNSAGAQYAIRYGDQTFGPLEVAPPKPPRKTRSARYAYGETRAYYQPIIQNMQPGDALVVPAGRFDLHVLTGNIASYCTSTWGRGSALVRKNDAGQCVQVLRLAVEDGSALS